MAYLTSFIYDEEGQDLIEYAFLVSFIAIVCVLALTALGTKVGSMWSQISVPLT
jgi:Flp pilus assembly pilin Flp